MAFNDQNIYKNRRAKADVSRAREEGFRQGLESAARTARLIGTEWWDHCAEPAASSAGYESAAKIADALEAQAKNRD